METDQEFMTRKRADKAFMKERRNDPEFMAKVNEQEQPQGKEYGTSDHVMALLNGASFGFGDNTLAAGGATREAIFNGKNVVDAYNRILSQLEGRQKDFTQDNPLTSAALNVTGGFASGAGLAKTMKNIINPATYKGAVALGGIEGGLSGLGNTQQGENAIRNTAVGATGGAVAGPVFKSIGDYITSRGLKNEAGRQLRKTMDEQGITIDNINDFLKSGNRNMPADMDELLMKGAAAANTPGPGQVSAYRSLYDRQIKMADDLALLMQNKTGGRIDFNAQTKQLNDKAIEQASPFYEEAHKAVIPITDTMKKFINDRKMQPLWNKARSRFETINGRVPTKDVNKIYRLRDGQSPNTTDYNRLELWDYFKQELDQKITRSYRNGYGTVGKSLEPRRHELLNELDEVVPAYKEARSIWSDSSRMKEALEEGRKVLRTDADDLYIENLTPGEKSMYINGATRAIVDKAQSFSQGGNSAMNMLNKPHIVKRMRNAFPDDETFNDFYGAMQNIAKQGKTYAIATQGSKTTPLRNAMDELATPSMMGTASDALQSGGLSVAKGAVDNVFKKRGQYLSSEIAKDLSDALFTNNTNKIDELTRKGLLSPEMLGSLLGSGQVPSNLLTNDNK